MHRATDYLHMVLERARCRELHPLHGIRLSVDGIANAIRLRSRKRARCQALRHLDDHQLSGIGATREAAGREARKWFWQ